MLLMNKWIALGLITFLLSACQEQAAQQQTEQIPSEPDLALTGLLIPGPNGATLYRCDNGQAVALIDSTDLMARYQALELYGAPAMATVSGPSIGATEVSTLTVTKVLSLNQSWVEAECVLVQHLQAVGNEPGWELRIHPPNDFLLRTNYGVEETTFPYVVPKYEDGRWTYEVILTSGGEASRLYVEVQDRACQDNMAGNRFPYTVHVTWDEQQFQGCGRNREDSPLAQP